MRLPPRLRALILRVFPDPLLEDAMRRQVHEIDGLDIRQPDPWWALIAGTGAERHPCPESVPCPACGVPERMACRELNGRVNPWGHLMRHRAARKRDAEATQVAEEVRIP